MDRLALDAVVVPGPHPLAAFVPELVAPRRTIGTRTFDFASATAVMAIVNRTPDSFYDRGSTFAFDRALAAALAAEAEGADWVDVGGVPFSPDVPPVSPAEEIDRIVPLIAAIRERSDIVISIDTTRAEVAAAGIAAGADVINDTNGLRDPALVEAVAGTRAHVVIAHSLARPFTHFPSPHYDDVVAAVTEFLRARVDAVVAAGIPAERIVIDPGHDLNKNTHHSLELTRRLREITAIGLPVLVALSNKDFVGETLDRERGQRLAGTLAATALCVQQGARIVRTHNVAPTVDAVRMTEAIMGLRGPVYARHNM